MQLSKIKLAGFKSFVDPTTIMLPDRLVAVVGPNGCGKSNIIDAVSWVMGESSPKYLRGESLTDVIFNGSTSRKPVGQASVELVFDNQDGSISGEYANFAEVSIKRMLARDSDSTYYLNGVRCRKRDVVDIFLGTGLGPRSYSIIGQNMIGRVIEAKPDELRTYLEEAAGISKYKERRHETELRIQHTKENLARVNDVRAELERQLNHLKYQANVAERYKTLKQQERVLKAECYTIQWRQLDGRMVEYTLKIQREQTALEAKRAELNTTERDLEQIRHEQRAAQDAFQEVQRRYYAVGNEITRIEQDILHHQERQEQWANDLKQTEKDWQEVKDQVEEAEDYSRDVEHELHKIEPQFASVTQETESLQNELEAAEEAMQTWQNQWDELNLSLSKASQTAQVEKTHIQHLEQKIDSLQKRQAQLQQEQSQFNFSQLGKELEDFSKQSYKVTDTLEFQAKQLSETRKEIATLQAAQQESTTHLDKLRSELQRLRGQQASLEALQQTALGQRDNPVASWSVKHQLENKPRLGQNIEVEDGWEFAVEKALGFCLQAICVDNMADVMSHVQDFKSGNLCIFTPVQTDFNPTQSTQGDLLLHKIKSSWSLDVLLAGIYVADSLQAALQLCESLHANESVITRDGIWLNRSWLKILREDNPAAGVFQREQELKQLAQRIEQLQAMQKELEKKLEERHGNIAKLERQRDKLQQTHSQHQAESAQIHAHQTMRQERLVELKVQSERCMKDQEECAVQLQQMQAERVQAHSLLQQAVSEEAQKTKEHDNLQKERDHLRQQLQVVRDNVNQNVEHMHELEIRLQTARSQKASLQQNITRMQAQLQTLTERKIALQSELSSMPSLDNLKKSLSRALDKHVSVEVEQNTARVVMESLDQEFKNLEENRQAIDRDINKVRSALEALRVEWQGWKVKAETIHEQIKETEFTLENVLKDLPEQAGPEEWQAKLEQVTQRINRLGAINLVAIDEYATCLERKQYLDKQLEDLQSGLATLEDAIAKIDKETRNRFKETFDKVNGQFQELFPTIFGGGRAYLELTSDNLLEAGVTVMACPPGKRNSTIYLLSGGEKTLTAIALIFSIFYLNPAPFCLLDEVDAALDDANVMRFCKLVKSMADKTQFIFISHNKVSIEMAENLIGVTMNEPGVSRLVSVDIEKAISMAGA